jgi:MFS family permease
MIKNSNITKIFIFNFFMMFMLTIPVIVPYWQDLGLEMKEIYELQAIYGVCLILLDLPLGYASDLFGRKQCLILAGIFNVLAFQILYQGTTFNHFVWFEIIAAISYAFYAGSDIAMLFDSGDAKKENLLGKKVFYSQLGETISALLSSLLAVISLKLPAEVNVYTSFIPLIVAFTLKEPEREKLSSKSHIENAGFILKSLFGHSLRLNFLIVFNIIYGLATYVAVWTYQANWKDMEIPVGYFGILWASSNVFLAFFARKAARIQKYVPDHFLILSIAVAPVIVFTLMGFFRTPGSLILMFVFSIIRAFNSVLIQHEINENVPSKIRATANSFCSLGMRGSFVLIGPVLGAMIDQKGIAVSLMYLGNIYILPFVFLAIPLLLMTRSNILKGYSIGCE